jgi:hypothetical protein
MKLTLSILAIALVAMMYSCGEKAKEIKDAMELVEKAPEMAQNMETSQAKAEQKWAERKQKGDTLAMNFKELQKFLPSSVSGYTTEEPAGESVNMSGLSFSQASGKFSRTAGDGSSEDITVEIMDYNAQSALFTAAAFWWISGFSREDGNGFERGFDPGVANCYGYEKYTKASKEAELTLAVGYRFIVVIKGDNQNNTEFLKSIAKSMNLNAMAGL